MRARIVVLAEEFGAGHVDANALRAGKEVVADAEKNRELRSATVDLPEPSIEQVTAWGRTRRRSSSAG